MRQVSNLTTNELYAELLDVVKKPELTHKERLRAIRLVEQAKIWYEAQNAMLDKYMGYGEKYQRLESSVEYAKSVLEKVLSETEDEDGA